MNLSFRRKLRKAIIDIIIKLIDYILMKFGNKYLISLKKLLLNFKADVIFVSEGKNWAIEWVGREIKRSLNKLGLIDFEIGTPYFARKKIIHFGSINILITPDGFLKLRKSNKIIVTWFHINPTDKRLKFVPILNKNVNKLITSSPITKKKLIELGFNEDNIAIIPLGVDLSHFKRYNNKQKINLKKKFNLPHNKIIIGSFQKDGIGWGEGLEPKLIKGPDIFCEVIKELHKSFNIHIFLTGPARGYVKKKLDEYKISYTHVYLENFLEIVDCYNVLDLYLVTSRVEGGPKAILEGMSTGVPIITTNVGMAPSLIKNGVNGFITRVDDIEQLYQFSAIIINDNVLKEKLITNAFKTVQQYTWEKISRQYYYKLYKRILGN